MKPTRMLTQEHDVIRNALDHLTRALDQASAGGQPPREFFETAIAFIHSFVDKFHHLREEYVLFTRLAEKRRGALDAEVDNLRNQHERCRDLIAGVAKSMDGYAERQKAHRTTLLENLTAYIGLLKEHIRQEEAVFYPLVDKELSSAEQDDIAAQFEKAQEEVGVGAMEANRKLVDKMGALVHTTANRTDKRR